MTDWPPTLARKKALAKIEELLAAEQESTELHFKRACLLAELGRWEEARAEYLELVARAPAHLGTLNNFGKLLLHMGAKLAAHSVCEAAVKYYPDNAEAHVGFANVLIKTGQPDAAFEHFQAALRLDPTNIDAHQGLAFLFKNKGDDTQAAQHRDKGFRLRPVLELGYCGEKKPVRLLLLASAGGGMVPVRQHLDERVFLASVVYIDYFDSGMDLPPHDFLFNIIGDADRCQKELHMAIKLLEKTTAPVINPPAAVIKTGRAANAQRLGNIPNVITPKMLLLPRSQMMEAALNAHGFTFPLLLRSPGFNTGRYFIRVDDAKSLAEKLPTIPGAELMAIEYLDARSKDGKIRKYRVMMINGKIYPLHAAISHEWKIHYFSAEMAENPENRSEDAAFLENMPGVLGPRAMLALEKIRDMMGLDYAGVDFSLSHTEDVIVFEANASMIVNPPYADARWDYRRPAVQAILDAIDRLLAKHVA